MNAQSKSGFQKAIKVIVLVDWNSQIHAARPGHVSELQIAVKTLEYVGVVIGRALYKSESGRRFDVSLRLYHGWHKGFEVTPRRKAILTAAAQVDFASISCKANVSIRENIEFGDRLYSASQTRIHLNLNCHLPNTLRNVIGSTGHVEEKMVDTAIASDLVDMAHREPGNWFIVLGEDDDLVPPVFVAEPIVAAGGGNVLLLRSRSGVPFLKTQDIWCKL